MSLRYKGAVISATPPTTTGGNSGTAPGAWTLQQQLQAQASGNWPPQPIWYVEDVFSTWLYTGTGFNNQSIANGIDTTKGALAWIKCRSLTGNNFLTDTSINTGAGNYLNSNNTNQAYTNSLGIGSWSWNNNGFSWTKGSSFSFNNDNGATFASWTFRKQPKFFDVVTYTGTGAQQNIAHSLGSTPGFIVCKSTSDVNDWVCWHRGDGSGVGTANGTGSFALNLVSAPEYQSGYGTPCNSSTFNPHLISGGGLANQNGSSYVAYLFAHNAGGFGLTGTDNVISCGLLTCDVDGKATVNLGYEPQFIISKYIGGNDDWILQDSMRGILASPGGSGTPAKPVLAPNLSNAESTTSYRCNLTSTGFTYSGGVGGGNVIYIAIRRGPMKTPTTGTSVFSANTTSAATGTAITTNFPVDLQMLKYRSGAQATMVLDRLRGVSTSTTEAGVFLQTSNTNAEVSDNTVSRYWNNTGYQVASGWTLTDQVNWNFRRAPGFFDEVCYTGTGNNATAFNHNLTVQPELIILKCRSSATDGGGVPSAWNVGYKLANGNLGVFTGLYSAGLNSTEPADTTFGVPWNDVASATTFTPFQMLQVGGQGNDTGKTYVAYLFSSCPGVSKVGSYTGTGATQTISCGFAARFVLIKRTNGTGNWWVWDTARGMVAGTDPRLAYNSTAAETNANWVYTDASGFQIVTTDATVNASGGSYIFLAIS